MALMQFNPSNHFESSKWPTGLSVADKTIDRRPQSILLDALNSRNINILNDIAHITNAQATKDPERKLVESSVHKGQQPVNNHHSALLSADKEIISHLLQAFKTERDCPSVTQSSDKQNDSRRNSIGDVDISDFYSESLSALSKQKECYIQRRELDIAPSISDFKSLRRKSATLSESRLPLPVSHGNSPSIGTGVASRLNHDCYSPPERPRSMFSTSSKDDIWTVLNNSACCTSDINASTSRLLPETPDADSLHSPLHLNSSHTTILDPRIRLEQVLHPFRLSVKDTNILVTGGHGRSLEGSYKRAVHSHSPKNPAIKLCKKSSVTDFKSDLSGDYPVNRSKCTGSPFDSFSKEGLAISKVHHSENLVPETSNQHYGSRTGFHRDKKTLTSLSSADRWNNFTPVEYEKMKRKMMDLEISIASFSSINATLEKKLSDQTEVSIELESQLKKIKECFEQQADNTDVSSKYQHEIEESFERMLKISRLLIEDAQSALQKQKVPIKPL